MARMSRESKVPYASLRVFKNEKALGEGYRAMLDKWLDDSQKQYSEPGTIRPQTAADVGDEVGILLHNLAAFMRNQKWTLTDRVNYLETNIGAIVSLIPALKREAAKAPQTPDSLPQKAPPEGRKK